MFVSQTPILNVEAVAACLLADVRGTSSVGARVGGRRRGRSRTSEAPAAASAPAGAPERHGAKLSACSKPVQVSEVEEGP